MFDCTDKITIWNRLVVDKKESWNRTIIPVLCKYKRKTIRQVQGVNEGQGTKIANTQMVIIPYVDSGYVDSSAWSGLDNSFTMQAGDLVALGEHDVEITGVSPHRLTDVQTSLKPDCFTVSSFQDNTRSRFGKHWKVEGV